MSSGSLSREDGFAFPLHQGLHPRILGQPVDERHALKAPLLWVLLIECFECLFFCLRIRHLALIRRYGPQCYKAGSFEHKGVIEILWEIFGGTETEQGYKLLNEHIGCIYGDSITLERANEICRRLAEQGFASGNIVLGVGSYTYQYATRDTHGFAYKATWCVVDGEEHLIYKKPFTDSGTKNSAKGRLIVERVDGKLTLVDNLNEEEWQTALLEGRDELRTVFRNGQTYNFQTLADVRARVKAELPVLAPAV